MLIDTVTGGENFVNSSVKTQVFVVPTIAGAEEKTVGQLARDNGEVRRVRRSTIPAAPGLPETFGKWIRASYEVPEGTVLKAWAQRKGPSQVAGRHVYASLFLQVRYSAPLVKIVAIRNNDPRGIDGDVDILTGRFDILTLLQATREGVVINPRFRGAFQEESQRLVFNVVEVMPATQARPIVEDVVVKNSTGVSVPVATRRNARALDLD